MEHNSLQRWLQYQLNWNQARVKFPVALILALVKLTTVNLGPLANAFDGTAKQQPNYRRIQRFYQWFEIPSPQITQVVLALLAPKSDFIFTIDVRLYFVLYQAEGLHINSKEPAQSQFQCVTCNMTNQSLIRSTIHVRYLYLLSSSWSWLRASSLWVSGSTGSWVSGQLAGLVAKRLQLMLKPLSFTFQRVLSQA